MALYQHYCCLQCKTDVYAVSIPDLPNICPACCKVIEQERKDHFLGLLKGLTIEERLSRIEQALYDSEHRKSSRMRLC